MDTRSSSTPRALDVPQDLIDSVHAGECVLFAGAGLSARAGVPTWDHFLWSLLALARDSGVIDLEYAASIEGALHEGNRDAAADELIQPFGNRRALLLEFLQRSFPPPPALSAAHEWLRQIPFASIVTSNYDSLLEKAFPEYVEAGLYTPKDAELLLDALAQKRRFMLKLYGIIERPDTLIFAPVEYREALSSNISFSKFVEGLFFSRNFFFIGLSLEGIQDFLSGFAFRGASPRKHFALAAVSGSGRRAKAQMLERRYNVRVIDFPVSETFPEVDTFVEKLSLAARPTSSGAGTATKEPVASTPGIRRVILEDIGCFERLELDFKKDTNWKILLGDNGVGKSTILKAIATAIIGSDARSYAGRLVRAGKTRGRITLETEQNPSGYVTDILTKDMVSEAEIVSIPARCMEAEGWLALGFSPLRIVTWTPSNGPQGMLLKGRPTAEDLTPLLSGEADPRMDRLKQWIVNLDAADKPGQISTLQGHTDRVCSVAFSPDGRTLVSGSIDQTVRVWDVWSGKESRAITGHLGGVNSVAISGDGNTMVSGSFDTTSASWNANSGAPLKTFRGNNSQTLSVAISADGKILISGSEGGSIRAWDVETGKELWRIGSEDGSVWAVAVSANGALAAAGSEGGKITVCDVELGRVFKKQKGSGDAIWAIALTRDGTKVVSGSENGTIRVWDLPTGSERTLQPKGSGVMSIALSVDGRTMASGNEDGTVQVWDLETGRETRSLKAHLEAVWSVALSPDGRTLATASQDRTIKLWNLPVSDESLRQYETIKKFFHLVATLTDRPDIDFLRVTENFRVMVKAAGLTEGVPLEVLSQGLTSLLGWVGVLCQRLRETSPNPGNDPLPTDAYALVLIDELDAHMHPRWQQALVQRLKKIFPNVQFIACTHSPLIVGGMGKSEVERLTLQDGKVSKVEFDSDMTLGRTDQILTGDLFALPSTLDMDTQDTMAEYEKLLGKSELTEEDERRLQKLGSLLEERIPPSPADPMERRARELIESLQNADLGLMPESNRKQIEERMLRLSKALRRSEDEA